MKRLKDLCIGLLLVLFIHFFDNAFKEDKMAEKKEIPTWAAILAFLAGLLFISSLFGCASNQSYHHFKVGVKAQNNLRFMFTTTQKAGWEFAFCGYGEVRNDTLFLLRISFPVITKARLDTVWSSPLTSGELGCDKFYVYPLLGHGHAHVNPAYEFCGLSHADVLYIKAQDTEYHFLACRDGTSVYRKSEIIKVANTLQPP